MWRMTPEPTSDDRGTVTASLFLSHAAADKAIIDALAELLESGVGVPPDEIFCSSIKGQGIRPGANFVDAIRIQLTGARPYHCRECFEITKGASVGTRPVLSHMQYWLKQAEAAMGERE